MAKRKGMLRRGVDPHTAAQTVINRYVEEANVNLPAWTANYQNMISSYLANPAAQQMAVGNLAAWYTLLLGQRGAIAGIFRQLVEQYKSQRGLAARPAARPRAAIPVPA